MITNSSTFPGTTTPTVADFNVTFPPTVPSNNSDAYKSSTIHITSTSTNCCSENYTQQNFNFSTSSTLTTDVETSTEPTGDPVTTVTESVHKFQRKIWAQDGYGGYAPYDDDQYTTPTSILLLNFFLIIFLMIVIGIAVYPAVKKYCDSTFFQNGGGNGNRYWIEDNEEVISVLTSNMPECSFALLNRAGSSNESIKRIAVSPDDSSSACSLDVLTESRRN